MRSFLGILLICLAAACVKASTEFLTTERFPPTVVDSVTVFIGVEELQADSIVYQRIALIFLEGDQDMTDQQDMIRKAREEAAAIGANGIIITDISEGGRNPDQDSDNPRRGRVMAVRWSVRR